ncbi:MAG: N-acetylglutaminylglutamine amidotransferase [Oceanospirillum sp.]|nr:N-acetylglutaminylglutamine amidotransferase [Oceanospirillum sp.]
MCGLAGIIARTPNIELGATIEKMTDSMRQRGPDAKGILTRNNTALGHRRLQIIDLTDQGQQPMADPELGLDVAFNGCIYNFQEIRQALKEKGYRFFSVSDTEVIGKAYHAWGKESFKRFNGMFAIAINDWRNNEVVLTRDRLGIKPLYYSDTDSALLFASTTQAILASGLVSPELDPAALNFYMSFHSVVPAPKTLLKEIKKVEPGTYQVWREGQKLQEIRWWQLSNKQLSSDKGMSTEDWKEALLRRLHRAVERRSIADVPVGVLLSGGVDSSLITGLLAQYSTQPLHTYSIGFESSGGERGDEFEYSDLIAKHFGTEHHKIEIPSHELLKHLPESFKAMSEPMVSYDNIAFWLLSREVSKDMKVVQSGQGADEVFGGYHWYPPLMSPQADAETYCQYFMDQNFERYQQMVQSRWVEQDYAGDFVRDHFASGISDSTINSALQLDTTVMLTEDPVKRVDNMTMAWGLEARVPFLDHEVVELAARMPPELKVKDDGKWILKEAARHVIPNAVIDRPKGYFPVPALKYIEGPYLEMVRDTLNSAACRERGLFQAHYIDTLLDNPKEHLTPLRGSRLWQVALLELWLQTHQI